GASHHSTSNSGEEGTRASLQSISRRRDTLATPYDQAKVGPDAILGLLTDIGDVYAKAEPAERRMLNRALFDRIVIDDEDQATLEPAEAIQTILATSPRPHNERTLPRDDAGQGSSVQLYVELRGFEPLTSSMPWKRATNCAIAPYRVSPRRATGPRRPRAVATHRYYIAPCLR